MILSSGSSIPPYRWSRSICLVTTVRLRKLSSSKMQYSLPVRGTGLSCTDTTRVSRSTTKSPVRLSGCGMRAERGYPQGAACSSATAGLGSRTSKLVDSTADGTQPRLAPFQTNSSRARRNASGYACAVTRPGGEIPVSLELSGVQTPHTVPFHRVMPRPELVDRQAITTTNLLQTHHTADHGFDERGFAPRGPALSIRGRQLGCRSFSPRQSLFLDVPHLRIEPCFNPGSYEMGDAPP